MKAKAQQDAEAALAEPLDVFRAFFLDDRPFIGGDSPRSRISASRRRSSSCRDRLRLPAWAKEYMAAMESPLGDAYSEPAADVRGYIASVKP